MFCPVHYIPSCSSVERVLLVFSFVRSLHCTNVLHNLKVHKCAAGFALLNLPKAKSFIVQAPGIHVMNFSIFATEAV